MSILLEQFTLAIVLSIDRLGQAIQSLNKRFKGHRSDVAHHLDWSNWAHHYNENDCDIKHDLEASVSGHATSSSD